MMVQITSCMEGCHSLDRFLIHDDSSHWTRGRRGVALAYKPVRFTAVGSHAEKKKKTTTGRNPKSQQSISPFESFSRRPKPILCSGIRASAGDWQAAAMGCFLGCFRIKDDGSRRCHLFSNSCSWKKKEVLSDRKQYASVGSCEGKNTPCDKAGLENLEENFDADDTDYDKLRQEAKFLKTCGAILETPIEIRKASVLQSVASDPCCKTINWDQQLDSIDDFPTKAPEIVTFEEVKPKSCQREETDDTIKKVVRFQNSTVEKKTGVEESDISPEVECQMQAPGIIYGSGSPYPTPLNLIDGLQTPGTIYPPKSENFRIGRIKTQFVFGVPDHSRRSFELETKNTMDSREEQSHSDNSPHVDRPIIGTAAAHWSGEDSSRISPRQWDGNGIPNSTTKYKEDQRVSWHATPFEVRLDKALSDEKVYPQRKVDGRLMELEDEGRG